VGIRGRYICQAVVLTGEGRDAVGGWRVFEDFEESARDGWFEASVGFAYGCAGMDMQ
jgi:hypothetical protein